MPNKITQDQMDELNECYSGKGEPHFPELLEEYTGIIARPYVAYQYFFPNGDYICDSDNSSLEDLMEEAEIEVVANA